MDIHRCRFVPFQPSTINAVAFSHSKLKKNDTLARLAVGRANGDIEIWNPSRGTWFQEIILRGGKGRSVDGLVWVNEPDQELGDGRVTHGKSRLFSVGYTSTVTEWDLSTAKPRRHASGQHGDIWCLAAQPSTTADGPKGTSQSCDKLVAGTINGELVMYDVQSDDLRFQRVLSRSTTKKTQMVSITFQNRKTVVVGCSDSTIRIYDLGQSRLHRLMTVGSDLEGGGKEVIVWSVKCLPNGDIVSGDSTGQLCIWDGTLYTQTQRIQGHTQDVLSLAISADGSAIMSGGMDRRTILYKENNAGGQRWGKVWGRRYHEHDVKAMASFEQGHVSVVVSAGPDPDLVVVPFREMGQENHRKLRGLPQKPPIASAPDARFVVSWWDRQVHVWLLQKPVDELLEFNDDADEKVELNRKLLKTIVLRGDSNITSASIDRQGALLVVSTSTDVKAFRLHHQRPARSSDLEVSSIKLPLWITELGATQTQLSPDCQWLCAVQEGSRALIAHVPDLLNFADCKGEAIKPQRLRHLRRRSNKSNPGDCLSSYNKHITHMAFSADSKMIAIADLTGNIDTWLLRDIEGDLKGVLSTGDIDDNPSSSSDSSDEEVFASSRVGRWMRSPSATKIPKLPSAPAVLSFSGSVPSLEGSKRSGGAADNIKHGEYTLLAITHAWQLLAFNPLKGTLTEWARPLTRKILPAAVQDLLDPPKGMLWQGTRAWIYGISFLLMIDTEQDLHTTSTNEPHAVLGVKRKRTVKSSGAGGQAFAEALAPRTIRRYESAEQFQDVRMSHTRDESGDSESDVEMIPEGEERSSRGSAIRSNQAVESLRERRKWWITYKYRPILGVVPLCSTDERVEVALVERPPWDVEMPARYLAANERER